MENKYYAVTTKCGHVGKGKFYIVTFAIKAFTKKEAAEKGRDSGGRAAGALSGGYCQWTYPRAGAGTHQRRMGQYIRKIGVQNSGPDHQEQPVHLLQSGVRGAGSIGNSGRLSAQSDLPAGGHLQSVYRHPSGNPREENAG